MQRQGMDCPWQTAGILMNVLKYRRAERTVAVEACVMEPGVDVVDALLLVEGLQNDHMDTLCIACREPQSPRLGAQQQAQFGVLARLRQSE